MARDCLAVQNSIAITRSACFVRGPCQWLKEILLCLLYDHCVTIKKIFVNLGSSVCEGCCEWKCVRTPYMCTGLLFSAEITACLGYVDLCIWNIYASVHFTGGWKFCLWKRCSFFCMFCHPRLSTYPVCRSLGHCCYRHQSLWEFCHYFISCICWYNKYKGTCIWLTLTGLYDSVMYVLTGAEGNLMVWTSWHWVYIQ